MVVRIFKSKYCNRLSFIFKMRNYRVKMTHKTVLPSFKILKKNIFNDLIWHRNHHLSLSFQQSCHLSDNSEKYFLNISIFNHFFSFSNFIIIKKYHTALLFFLLLLFLFWIEFETRLFRCVLLFVKNRFLWTLLQTDWRLEVAVYFYSFFRDLY